MWHLLDGLDGVFGAHTLRKLLPVDLQITVLTDDVEKQFETPIGIPRDRHIEYLVGSVLRVASVVVEEVG